MHGPRRRQDAKPLGAGDADPASPLQRIRRGCTQNERRSQPTNPGMLRAAMGGPMEHDDPSRPRTDDRTRSRRTGANVLIREMELEDLAAVYELGERLFTADKWPTLYRTWDQYELVEMFASDGETCLVAEDDDKVIGFALGTLIEKRRSAWTYGYLLWIGVDAGAGRKGVGARLVRRMTDIFIEMGARMMLVDTDADNTAALAFFRDIGFGNDSQHVYLQRNLSTDPGYIRKRRRKPPPRHGIGPVAPTPSVGEGDNGDTTSGP